MKFLNIKKIQAKLREKNLDVFLVTNPSSIFYLIGLKGSLAEREFLLIISKYGFEIVVPRMYLAEAEKTSQGNFAITRERGSLFGKAIESLREYKNIGFEKEDLKYGEYENLKRNLKGEIIPISRLVEDLRKIKDEEEILKIKKAAEIVDKTFSSILKIIRPGLTEKFIQRRIIEMMEDFGAEGPAFLPIVASGKKSAEPHYQTSNKKIKKGEILLLDFGAKYKGYCSDFTRTIFIGKAPQRFKKIYNLVLEIQKMAIKNCQKGYEIKKLYQDAVSNFKKYDEDRYFLHSLGHGLGIDAHEFPNVGPETEGSFENGMTITIEPGLYYKNFGGIRIEDTCLIEEKCKQLTKVTKELIEI